MEWQLLKRIVSPEAAVDAPLRADTFTCVSFSQLPSSGSDLVAMLSAPNNVKTHPQAAASIVTAVRRAQIYFITLNHIIC